MVPATTLTGWEFFDRINKIYKIENEQHLTIKALLR